MATMYKKKYPIPMPDGAEIITRRGKRIVRWVDGRGRRRTAELTSDGERIYFVSDVWYARYRDADSIMRRVSTGCRDQQAARKVLADRLAEVEKVKAGIITSAESKIARHAKTPLASHVEDYLAHMRACERSASHRENTRRYLERTFTACGLSRISDLATGPIERWLLQEAEKGRSARSRNAFRIALVSFANWAVRSSRLASNPFAGLPVANEAADRRRIRRPLTMEELARLLDVAERRPLAEYGRRSVPLPMDKRRGRKTWTKAPLTVKTLDAAARRARYLLSDRPALIALLEARGRRNAMFYRLAAFTGLRKGELASILLLDVHLDTTTPYLELRAAQSKAGRGAKLPLKADMVDMVRDYIARQRQATNGDERSLLLDAPLFKSPTLKTFNLDLAVAGIEKVDSSRRSVDIHSLRHTFGTMLARAGVAPRTAQELMRHSDIRLTTNIYQHLELIDTANAVEMLPNLETSRTATMTAAEA